MAGARRLGTAQDQAAVTDMEGWAGTEREKPTTHAVVRPPLGNAAEGSISFSRYDEGIWYVQAVLRSTTRRRATNAKRIAAVVIETWNSVCELEDVRLPLPAYNLPDELAEEDML